MKVDEIIPLLGSFGRYQFFIVAYMNILSIFCSMTTLSNVFFAAETDHWCQVLPKENCSSWVEFQDNCTDAKKAVCLPPPERENSKYPYSNCEQWVIPDAYQFNPYDNLNGSRVECQSGWEYDTSQYKTTTISDFDLVCDDGGRASLAQSIYFVGFLVGSFTFGTLSDWIGRKKATIIGLIFWSVGAIVTTFSVNIYMYTAFRFIAGIGNIGSYISLFVLVLELIGKSWRTAVSMSSAASFSIGYFVVAVAAMYVREWRPLSFFMSVPMVILFFPVPFFQESVSWLVSKGKIEEAEEIVRRIAKFNKKTLPDVLFTKEDIQEQTESKQYVVPPSFIDLYKTPNMAVKTINMQFNWLVNSLIYYGLSQSTGDLGVDDYWAFFVSGAVEIPAVIYATFAVDKFGRKWNTAILEMIGGVACFATIFIPIGIWRTVVSMAGKFCITATFSITYLYTTELFPTPVRAISVGFCSVAGRIGGILSPIILLLGDYFEALPSIVFSCCAVLAGLLVLFLPETMGQKLPQTLQEGEDFGKCKCMGGGTDDHQSIVDLEEIDASEDGLALTNPAFEATDENMEKQI